MKQQQEVAVLGATGTRRHSHACSTDHRPCHMCTKTSPLIKKKKETKTKEAVQTTQSYLTFVNCPTFKVKKETQK